MRNPVLALCILGVTLLMWAYFDTPLLCKGRPTSSFKDKHGCTSISFPLLFIAYYRAPLFLFLAITWGHFAGGMELIA